MGLFSRRGGEGVPQPSGHERALKSVCELIPNLKLETMGEMIGFNVSPVIINRETLLSITGLTDHNEIGLDAGTLSAMSIEINEALEINDQPFAAEVVAMNEPRNAAFGEDSATSTTSYLIRIIPVTT